MTNTGHMVGLKALAHFVFLLFIPKETSSIFYMVSTERNIAYCHVFRRRNNAHLDLKFSARFIEPCVELKDTHTHTQRFAGRSRKKAESYQEGVRFFWRFVP